MRHYHNKLQFQIFHSSFSEEQNQTRSTATVFQMAPRVGETSKAVKVLRKRFESVKFTAQEETRSVQDSDPLFHEFKLDTFQTQFYILKKDDCGDGKVNRLCVPNHIYELQI